MIDEHLAKLSAGQLRAEWRRLHKGTVTPKGLGRDLIARAIVWRKQARMEGGLTPAIQRTLDRFAIELVETGDIKLSAGLSLKPGTRLVRQWHGDIYQVQVLDQGFKFEERHFRSLTQIARKITGTAWSGPRFFGLKASPDARN
ncbi:DUF2924 domain-containing protein [Sphingorhabdus soli]|uniref:DUF2924 domain-containing protein n=1 Tax=Flavisphingopyxis soli TaxID=2601267 RepID=A0A5C6UKT7_9SPHN|nr:DUF2924 domain-containing protein [Sphingorhabdus soli]TXC73752.1 DUF2924 domain-containing protein [Sphingorhabdus soli]